MGCVFGRHFEKSLREKISNFFPARNGDLQGFTAGLHKDFLPDVFVTLPRADNRVPARPKQ
jgi:hypothetical protein